MTFADAATETRERLTESFALLTYLRSTSPSGIAPLDEVQKASRGLWLVSLYAALERSVNAIVEAGIDEISSHGTQNIMCIAPIHSLVQFSQIQSVKDCKHEKVFDQAIKLFEASMGSEPASLIDNPLSKYLQNVDATTISWVCSLFGTSQYVFPPASSGRLRTLRERRNAVAHGRESASQVGQRYSLDEMATLYGIVDVELARFRLHLEDYCTERRYVRAA